MDMPASESNPAIEPFSGSESPDHGLVTETEAEVRKQLADSKVARKKAEEDRKVLANRLRLLRLEEEKALKKIELTRKKAKEIAEIKLRNAEEQKRREEAKRKKEEQRKKLQAAYKGMKEQIKSGIQQTKLELLKQKQAKSSSIKTEKAELRKSVSAIKSSVIGENKWRKEQVKFQEQKMQESRYKSMDGKKEKVMDGMEEQIIKENEDRMKFEAEITKMEQEEFELIKRLQNTHQLQQTAYNDLENMLATPSSVILENKLKKGFSTNKPKK